MEGGIRSPFGRRHTFYIGENIPGTMIKNHPVQGFGADIVSLIRVMLYERIGNITGIAMSNTVHDSIEVDCTDDYVELIQVSLDDVLNNLSREILHRFKIDFDLNILCEVSIK